MTITKELFVDLHEKYHKVQKLVNEDSKTDPENAPFLSKYAARQIMIGMRASLEKFLTNGPVHASERLKITAMLGVVHMNLGNLAIDTEEFSTGEQHLDKCLETIRDHINTSRFVMIALNVFNQFGILSVQGDPEKAKRHLENAQKVYLKYKEEQSDTPPVNFDQLFEIIESPREWNSFERLYTFTLYYLAQVYATLKDALKSSVYCHITLQRQLESNDYEPIDWALNAATLSQFFIEKNGFKQARNHLASSLLILEQYEKKLNEVNADERDEAYDAKVEEFKHRSADVARCWAKYGILLLSKSKERLLNHTDDDLETHCTITSDLSNLTLDQESSVSREDLLNLEFNSLDLSRFELQITHKFILTIQDARLVFVNAQNWLNRAESYYTLENLASDHIEIVQDHTQLYLNLLFFEESPENQAKLHKRRVDLLETVIAKINPQYYLQYCRQIWFELGQTYSDICNIKSDRLREISERPSPQALAKINTLITKSLCNFNSFADSFKEGVDKVVPVKIADEFERTYLQAFLHMAALHTKFITLDKRVQLLNAEKSLDDYKRILDYCELNPKARDLLPTEIGICKEMVNLLPVKVAKLKKEAGCA